ncbi:MAG: PAS domain S-box protein [Methanosarcinaceae archaeon]
MDKKIRAFRKIRERGEVMRLYTKSILLIVLVAFFIGSFSLVLVNRLMRSALEDEMQKRCIDITQTISETITENVINGEVLPTREILRKIVQRSKDIEFAYVVGFDGNVFVHSFEKGFPKILAKQIHEIVTKDAPHLDRYFIEKKLILTVGYPLIDDMLAHLHIGMNESNVHNQIRELRNRIMVFTLIVAFLGILLAGFISFRISAPLKRLADSMYAFGKGEQEEKIEFHGGGKEVEELTQSFKQMIIERKRAEEALRESEERYRGVVEDTPVLICCFLPGSEITFVNKAYCEYFARTPEELVGSTFLALIPEDDRETVMANISALTVESPTQSHEHRVIESGGDIHWQRWTNRALFDARGKAVAYQSIGEDITERKQFEEALQKSKNQMQAILDGITTNIAFVNDKLEIKWVNKAAADSVGKTPEEIIGGKCHVFWADPEKPCANCPTLRAFKTKRSEHSIMTTPDGRIWEERGEPVFDTEGKIIGVVEIAHDITERKQAEEALRDSEEKHRTTIENLPLGVLALDQDGVITTANPAFTKIFDLPSDKVVGKTIINSLSFIQDINLINNLSALTEKSTHFDFESQAVTMPSGKLNYLRIRGIPIQDFQGNTKSFLVVIGDITGRKQAEEEKARLETQLRRSQKLETIGTLAGGIAHDFNNILTPIMGYTDMALSDLAPSNPLCEDLKHILKGANRAKDLVEQILLFSKQVKKERKPLALHLIVKEAIKLLRPSIPSTIEIRQRIDASCDKVLVDATQMHQVIINLCTNAWQAMEENGSMLTIELKQVEVDAATAKLYLNLNEAEYVRLTVIDTGSGMDTATLERIFEPFFTTKPVDKGTGMGLSVVHGIVRGHQGDILVYSEPGKGSTFHVYLPIVKAEVEAEKKEKETIVGGQESILIIDDEKAVANILKKILERLGYQVDASNSSPEALKIIRQQPDKYDLVISDLTMPNMTGLDLSEKLQQLRSGFPVIIMTGYGDSLTSATQQQYGIKQVIGKPVAMRELALAVREVLDN